MRNEKIQTLKEIEPVNSLKQVQYFLGFANFYRRFIKDYSKIVLPITNSMALNTKDWIRTPEIEAAQQHLTTAFTTAPVLKHFNPDLPAIVETDASDFTLGAIISQTHEGRTHPVAFQSRKFTQAEINYDTADKELLAIVDSFKRWRRFLEGANHQVQVITDHQNLELFETTKVLNRQQARWAQELASYDFRIFFRPGRQIVKADYLTCRPEKWLEKGVDRKPKTILKPENLYDEHTTHLISGTRECSIPPIQWNEEFLEEVRKAASLDEQYQSGLRSLSADPGISDYIQPSKYLTLVNDILHYKARLYMHWQLVPSILQSEHDSQIAGHFGMDKTTELIRWNFWWPSIIKEIEEDVKSCPDCQKNKVQRHKQYGLLSPLELPYVPWQSIVMGFITDLPLSNGCTELWVVIDRFTKMAHFISLKDNAKTTVNLARRFAKEIWRLNGLPRDIVSDRDSRFTSSISKEFLTVMGIRPWMSPSFHLQTDGQTQCINQDIEAYLRPYLNKGQDDWTDLLPMAEHAYNNLVTSATVITPIYANYGRYPEILNPQRTEVMNPAAHIDAHGIKAVLEKGKIALEAAWKRMSKNTDNRCIPPPAYKIGDPVMLSTQHIKTKKTSRKLDHKYFGPFQIDKSSRPLQYDWYYHKSGRHILHSMYQN